MECVPPCAACVRAGECTRVWRERPRRPSPQRRYAKAAAIESGYRAYIEMACGHFTTREVQEACAIWRPKGKDYLCEACGHWVKAKPKPEPEPLPDIPLF